MKWMIFLISLFGMVLAVSMSCEGLFGDDGVGGDSDSDGDGDDDDDDDDDGIYTQTCQNYCDDFADCAWNPEYFDGTEEELAEACAEDCLGVMQTGCDIVDAESSEVTGGISGQLYHQFFLCTMDLYVCLDGYYSPMHYQSDCISYDVCLVILDIDYSASWDSEYESCILDGGQGLICN